MTAIKNIFFGIIFILLINITHAKSILIIGDSISAGFGINPDHGWVKLLTDKLHEEDYPYTVINSSISGDTTTNGLSRLPTLLDKYQPDITIIELGGNDGLRATPPNKIESNLSKMITLAHNANSKVLLVGIQLPPNYGTAYLKRFITIYPTLAESHNVALLPSIVEKTGGKNELMQADGIHPNELGQPIIMNSVWEKLQPLLTK